MSSLLHSRELKGSGGVADPTTREARRDLRLRRPGDSTPPQSPEFFRRELGIDATEDLTRACDCNPDIPRTRIAHCSTYPEELYDLSVQEGTSILLLVESDETFRTNLTRAILRHPEVRRVLRCYSIESSGWLDLPQALMVALRTSVYMGVSSLPGALMAWSAGVVVAGRKSISRRLLGSAGVVTHPMPLGYTDAFVQGVEALGTERNWRCLTRNESVITYLSEHLDDLTAHKCDELAFVGQQGKFQRRAALHVAQALGFSIGPIHETFGGPGRDKGREAANYVTALARSRFSLCPPGNYSGESFRLGESLLLGALPLEASCVISEPGWRPGRWTSGRTIARRNLADSLEEARRMSETERFSRLLSARSAYVSAVRTTREALAHW